jgi:hypothetical protein
MLREQGATLFELQASIALARLLMRTGRLGDGRSLLSQVLGVFANAPELPDVERATALLKELA